MDIPLADTPLVGSPVAGVVPHPVCREADGLGGSGYASSGFNRAPIR